MANYEALGGGQGRARPPLLWVQQRKQLLGNFINTQQSLSWFSSFPPQGGALLAVALLCAAVFLQDAGKGEGALCLCPSSEKRQREGEYEDESSGDISLKRKRVQRGRV